MKTSKETNISLVKDNVKHSTEKPAVIKNIAKFFKLLKTFQNFKQNFQIRQ